MVKKGVVSVQENWRTDAVIPHEQVFTDLAQGIPPQIFVFRHMLEKQSQQSQQSQRSSSRLKSDGSIGGDGHDGYVSHVNPDEESGLSGGLFSDLVEQMSSVRLAAPFYIVMAGPAEGQSYIEQREPYSPFNYP